MASSFTEGILIFNSTILEIWMQDFFLFLRELLDQEVHVFSCFSDALSLFFLTLSYVIY